MPQMIGLLNLIIVSLAQLDLEEVYKHSIDGKAGTPFDCCTNKRINVCQLNENVPRKSRFLCNE